jgi:hypothetical protein
MPVRRIYYTVKPYVHWRMRLAFRQWLARRALRRAEGSWPVLESAGGRPEGWPGWPEGKQFAFVLTHDVESQRGLDRVKPLAELETELGFRSSFYLVPEGEYRPTKELRDWLTSHGFEVGVHDLHHDGTLFRSRGDFRRQARRINHYLKEWGAKGFRAAFMFHNLDWIRGLNIEYDASTFDTDPFEPQPDGMETIFPFSVPRRHGPPGYIELPYTLVQDSTLFLLLREKSIDIWKRKVDWVAQRGGMALVIVHPDYLDFEGSNRSSMHYPPALYRELLQYVREKYCESYWHALPREVAAYVSEFQERRRGRLIGSRFFVADCL